MAWVEKSGQRSWRVRYRREDGTIGAVTGFATRTAAVEHAETLESDQRRGEWIDPAAGKTTVEQWSEQWWSALDVAAATEDQYRSLLTRHILPRWGPVGLSEISGIAVAGWAKSLRERYSDRTVSAVVKLLSLLLADAVDERLIVANPIRPRRRGRAHRRRAPERVWATPGEALAVADNAARLPGAGPDAAMLIVTAAWTGARWGELTGLRRPNLYLDLEARAGTLRVVDHVGSLHETSRGLQLGPPKTAESVREISLPPFLVVLLDAHLHSHDHEHVFVTTARGLHRRSNFSRRAMRPAADGVTSRRPPMMSVAEVKRGLSFHGLRHSHKTWMIADSVPEIAQARRLGHVLDDKIRQVYSHVATEVDQRLLAGLQHRWDKAAADSSDSPVWRAAV